MRIYICLIALLISCCAIAQQFPCWGCPSVSIHESLKAYQGFTLSFNPDTKIASWVFYTLNPAKISAPKVKRNTKFKPDYTLPGGTASHADYKKSGFDKGHLAPAADMAWSQASMNDCFYYSNIAPQYPECNRGIWKQIEDKVRTMARHCDSLMVFTGPVFKQSQHRLGLSNILIPQAYYKIIAVFTAGQINTYAVVIPNARQFITADHYACSITAIEQLTGLNFFLNVNRPYMQSLKQRINLLNSFYEN